MQDKIDKLYISKYNYHFLISNIFNEMILQWLKGLSSQIKGTELKPMVLEREWKQKAAEEL